MEVTGMYAVFTIVEMAPGRNSAAVQMLKEQLIPQVKQDPGFVRGTWFGTGELGHGVVVFESKEQADAAVQPIGSIVLKGVRVVRSDVYRVDADARELSPQPSKDGLRTAADRTKADG
jgi:hypothetical protein